MRHTLRISHLVVAASLLAALSLTGCATHRQAQTIIERIDAIEAQTSTAGKRMASLDSTLTSEALESRKLRADMNLTLDELRGQISSLLENYNDLLQKLDELRRQPARSVGTLQSSPGAVTGATADSGMADRCTAQFEEAFILVRQGKYDGAIEGFRTYLTGCPGHSRMENAYYWIGESYYALEKYDEAITEFTAMLEKFKPSSLTGKALYKLGRSQQEKNKKQDARKSFQRVIDEFPNSLEAEQAKERLKDLR